MVDNVWITFTEPWRNSNLAAKWQTVCHFTHKIPKFLKHWFCSNIKRRTVMWYSCRWHPSSKSIHKRKISTAKYQTKAAFMLILRRQNRRFKTPFTGVLFMLPSRRRRFREHALRIVRGYCSSSSEPERRLYDVI